MTSAGRAFYCQGAQDRLTFNASKTFVVQDPADLLQGDIRDNVHHQGLIRKTSGRILWNFWQSIHSNGKQYRLISLRVCVVLLLQHFVWFLLLRALVGVGEASYCSIAPSIIADLFTDNARTIAMTAFYFAITVGRSTQPYIQGRRQVKKCGVDKHGERAERKPIREVWSGAPMESRGRTPTPLLPSKNSPDLHQSQERPLAKVGWTCPPQSTRWRRPCPRLSDENILVLRYDTVRDINMR